MGEKEQNDIDIIHLIKTYEDIKAKLLGAGISIKIDPEEVFMKVVSKNGDIVSLCGDMYQLQAFYDGYKQGCHVNEEFVQKKVDGFLKPVLNQPVEEPTNE